MGAREIWDKLGTSDDVSEGEERVRAPRRTDHEAAQRANYGAVDGHRAFYSGDAPNTDYMEYIYKYNAYM